MGYSRLFRCLPFAAFLAFLSPVRAQNASYIDASHSTLRLEVDGKQYLVDVASGTVRPSDGDARPASPGVDLFAANCSACHGPTGKGTPSAHTPDFTDPQFQAKLTEDEIAHMIRNGRSDRMPAFAGKLNNDQIKTLTTYVKSFASSSSTASANGPASSDHQAIYKPGDDLLFSLPTGRAVDRRSFTVNFTHRFPYGPAFSDSPGSGSLSPQFSQAFGLDNFALASLGVRYGITNKLSVDMWRSSSFIGRPIQLMVAYNVLDEHHEQPFNLAFRVSVEGQDNFRKNYTENIETIVSRSITSKMQVYFVPTASFNDRRLLQGSLESNNIADVPGVNAFSLGFGVAIDIRPSIALIGEIIPTVIGGPELGIHRPPFALAIQKKLFRHAFTFGVTTSPGTTVSQRAGTNATFLNNPSADTPSGLFLGFDLTRQIY